jgi:hypothetical protein
MTTENDVSNGEEAGSGDSLAGTISVKDLVSNREYEDVRHDTRLPFEVRVDINTPGHNVRGTSRNVSLSGLFINTEHTLPLDSICEVEIVLASGEPSIKCMARVVRIVAEPEAGLGMLFLDIDDGV